MAAHDNRATGHDHPAAARRGGPATARATKIAARIVGSMALAGSLTGIVAAGGAARITAGTTSSTSRAASYPDCPWDLTSA